MVFKTDLDFFIRDVVFILILKNAIKNEKFYL